MRVFLSVKIILSSVHQLLVQYVEDNDEMKEEYSSLMDVILNVYILIGIWNHLYAKGCTFIDCPEHEYINEMDAILAPFTNWKEETGAAKNLWANFSLEIYNDLCRIVNGLKYVAMYYLRKGKGWAMVQSLGGTDDVEHDFSHQRSKNSNPTIRDCDQTLGRDAVVKSTTFSLRAKSNTSGDKVI